MLEGKKIIIGITGGIAAFKIPYLVRLLKKEGAEVQVIMTAMAREFVTPLTLSTVSENPVLSQFFNKDDGSWHSHVDLGLWADLMIVAPLSANTMAKMAGGVADNLLLTTILSARCPIYFAPAMDLDMYRHPTTTKNVKTLQSFGYHLIEPAEGELASGLSGLGRMEEPEKILEIIKADIHRNSPLQGIQALVTAGPTHEPIDPVRYIGNHSSGKMGTEIAMELARKGADVHLVLGPVTSDIAHPRIKIVNVNTAAEMYSACMKLFPDCRVAVMSAAVADFTPSQPAKEKIKKGNEVPEILLVPTKDILAEMGKMKQSGQILVGFALETADPMENAQKKLQNKNLDFIVLNSMRDKGAGFGYDTNKVTILSKDENAKPYPLKSKREVASDIVNEIGKLIE
jgi:phosphopantothenoylcysteine decarboxylase / phosphopantothenate---cysteine ligase